ncbi:ATP synthase subunit gamma [Saitoella complicata NRRL Y-17804]|uniref:ATP synthase subunit gamma n=1 Tax=Saitoella complicata (strain BCRC 22490 / CBS 7301 / JCM 7358 / NBRC 10748 / NRRL Y-17804) TaxID=698492 RepID=A0A0E9NLK3_SAICN|nr:ATP synthase subunit gamma [Saitoella complicata NRRL Y-17804]ODQ55506.1 ATP synthase subunit gamma [Saitoella complicata NRRL Y-17804]GAO50762.1 hypothetical protein G7K_4883-t1 [Saitoella complicata NRRL Y-17804]
MFSRAVRPAANLAARQAVAASSRNMATLREIEGRLKSIKNIEKITKTMKTVASTKLQRAQRVMEAAKSYGQASESLYKNAEAVAPAEGKTLYIIASSDKGLCGGTHSQLTKTLRRSLAASDSSSEAEIAVIGDKCKAQISRFTPENIVLSFNGVGQNTPTFLDAAVIADQIMQLGHSYDKINIVYNRFASAISCEPDVINAFSTEALTASPGFSQFEIEDEVLDNLKEFSLANAIYWALAEGHACEISARRTAMENASKNAGDMINRFGLLYNRTRQAVITNELVDIITGASALN